MTKATFAGGCFWCIEAVFKRLNGVGSVMSGYAGQGQMKPTYESVSSGLTPYVEAVQIEFDPGIIPYQTLLDVFWAVHDPTTLNRQGADVGPQYRSAIFYHNQEQETQAKESKQNLEVSGKYGGPIVTAIEPYTEFYPAEEGHRDFYDRNREYGYCRLVIDPKIQKLNKDFKAQLKTDSK